MGLLCGWWRLSSGPQACVARALPAEPSSQPHLCVQSPSPWDLCSSSYWHRVTLNLLCNPGWLEFMILLPQSLQSLGLQASAISPRNNQIFEHFHHKEIVNTWIWCEYAKYPEFSHTVYQYQSITKHHMSIIHITSLKKSKHFSFLVIRVSKKRLNFFV